MPRNTGKHILIKLSSLAIVCVLLPLLAGLITVGHFDYPIAVSGDASLWENVGYYFRHNLRFCPLPQLDLHNNQTFYPYGTSQVFHGWGFERDYFSLVMNHFVGRGPWLQIYFMLSLVILAAGAFILMLSQFDWRRSLAVALIVSLFNFYGAYKFPGHLNISISHWTTLGILADFLLARKFFCDGCLPLRLVLTRCILLILAMGQDLGYVAGYSLTSFVLLAVFIIASIVIRKLRRKEIRISFAAQWRCDFRKPTTWLLVTGLLVVTYLYLPLAVQIATEARRFHFSGSEGGWWAHPLRIFMPYLPYLNPDRLQWLWNDSPEGLGAGSIGWFLLILGLIGLWQNRKRIAPYGPMMATFFLCLFNNPKTIPILKVFPWFDFNRVGGRCTVIYPAVFAALAAGIVLPKIKTARTWIIIILLCCLGITELVTGYNIRRCLPPPPQPREDFMDYMNYVASREGEAVLDWPFSIAGGNGVGGNQGLAPFYNKNGSVGNFRAFHHKKVVGKFFGRLHFRQIEPFLMAGWQYMLMPDRPIDATRQLAFNEEQWRFFTEFFIYNDFAGINLYPDLLSPETVAEFHKRFGKPTVETWAPDVGRMQFIPKQAESQKLVDLQAGRQLRYQIPEKFLWDLITYTTPYKAFVTDLKGIRPDPSGGYQRRMRNTSMSLEFELPDNMDMQFKMRLNNPGPNRVLSLTVNDVTHKLGRLLHNSDFEYELTFPGKAGGNRITIEAAPRESDYVERSSTAIRFRQLVISAVLNGHTQPQNLND